MVPPLRLPVDRLRFMGHPRQWRVNGIGQPSIGRDPAPIYRISPGPSTGGGGCTVTKSRGSAVFAHEVTTMKALGRPQGPLVPGDRTDILPLPLSPPV